MTSARRVCAFSLNFEFASESFDTPAPTWCSLQSLQFAQKQQSEYEFSGLVYGRDGTDL